MRRASILALGALIGGGFYLLLIDTASLPELYALAGVALACGVAFLISRDQGFAESTIRPGLLTGAWRVAVKIPLDIVVLCAEALAQTARPRAARGTFRAARFRAVEATPEATARRALTEALGSVSPNTIVLGVDAEHGLIIVHQLRRRGEPGELDVMGLG